MLAPRFSNSFCNTRKALATFEQSSSVGISSTSSLNNAMDRFLLLGCDEFVEGGQSGCADAATNVQVVDVVLVETECSVGLKYAWEGRLGVGDCRQATVVVELSIVHAIQQSVSAIGGGD